MYIFFSITFTRSWVRHSKRGPFRIFLPLCLGSGWWSVYKALVLVWGDTARKMEIQEMEWFKVWQMHTHTYTHTSVRQSLLTDPSASCTALIIDKEPSISRQPDLPNTLHTLMDTREKYPAGVLECGISYGRIMLPLQPTVAIHFFSREPRVSVYPNTAILTYWLLML